MNTATRLAALSPDGYRIPAAVISRRRITLLMSISLAALFGWLSYRAAQDTGAILGHDHEALLWSALMLVASHQTLLAWFDKPYTVTSGQADALRLEPLCVSVPLYNESPEIVDRVMYALAAQTWLPTRIVVVDDGSSKYDYALLREFWCARFAELGVVCEWHRQANAGKRHAQAVAFRSASTGFMVTLDSDTTLARDALEEIVKPFADHRVWSVAGLELAYNQTANLLTRINGMRQLSWQMVQCAALNRFGAILVNRGTCAAYRAEMTYQTAQAYLAETFLGKPVRYSDDSLLTLYALGRGRAVQQVSAHQYSEYAETLSHALRQWTRWMRGATIRSVWRAKYLPLRSYAGAINALNWWQLAASSAAYVYVGIVLPYEGRPSLSALSAAIGASYLANVRTLLIRRDDQDGLSQLDTWLLSPLAWAWSLLVLRPIRAYAVLTCANNGWGTRAKIEVGALAGRAEPAVPRPVAAPVPVLCAAAAGPDRGPGVAVTAEMPAVEESDPYLDAPVRSRLPRRNCPAFPVTVLATGVSALAAGIICVGLVYSLSDNVVSPAAPAAPHAGAHPSGGAVTVPTVRASAGPTRPAGALIVPVAKPSTLAPATSPAPSATASAPSSAASATPSPEPTGTSSPSATPSQDPTSATGSASPSAPSATGTSSAPDTPDGSPS